MKESFNLFMSDVLVGIGIKKPTDPNRVMAGAVALTIFLVIIAVLMGLLYSIIV